MMLFKHHITFREMTHISLRLLSNPFHSTDLLYYLCYAYCIKKNRICLNQMMLWLAYSLDLRQESSTL